MNAKIEEPGVLTPRFKNHGERMILGYRMLDNYMVRAGGVMWRKAMHGHLVVPPKKKQLLWTQRREQDEPQRLKVRSKDGFDHSTPAFQSQA